jgi:hypothetical protein
MDGFIAEFPEGMVRTLMLYLYNGKMLFYDFLDHPQVFEKRAYYPDTDNIGQNGKAATVMQRLYPEQFAVVAVKIFDTGFTGRRGRKYQHIPEHEIDPIQYGAESVLI